MTTIEICQKKNEIERIKFMKIIDDESGKVSYEIINRNLIKMEEESFPYKRIDFAIKRYMKYAGWQFFPSELKEMAENTILFEEPEPEVATWVSDDITN